MFYYCNYKNRLSKLLNFFSLLNIPIFVLCNFTQLHLVSVNFLSLCTRWQRKIFLKSSRIKLQFIHNT